MTKQNAKRINEVAARLAVLPADKKGEKARDAAYVRNSTAIDDGALVRRVAAFSR